MQTNYKLQNAYNLVNLSDNNVMFEVKSSKKLRITIKTRVAHKLKF